MRIRRHRRTLISSFSRNWQRYSRATWTPVRPTIDLVCGDIFYFIQWVLFLVYAMRIYREIIIYSRFVNLLFSFFFCFFFSRYQPTDRPMACTNDNGHTKKGSQESQNSLNSPKQLDDVHHDLATQTAFNSVNFKRYIFLLIFIPSFVVSFTCKSVVHVSFAMLLLLCWTVPGIFFIHR